MEPQIIEISGSPIKNSNTDRLVQAVLDSSGLESEFVKLSRINVRPCFACRKCVPDNICKVKDDFQELAEKIKNAKALIIGAYTPYSQIDGFTKALLERFWSFHHKKNLLNGKLCATVLTGLDPNVLDTVNNSLKNELENLERMELVGQLTIQGNVPCVFCKEGDVCEMSAVKPLYGPDAKTSEIKYARVEGQSEVWDRVVQIGQKIAEKIKN